MRDVSNSMMEASEFGASEEYGQVVSAAAILQNTVIGKILGNLFTNFRKPPYPTKLFTSEDAVIDWLKGFVNRKDE